MTLRQPVLLHICAAHVGASTARPHHRAAVCSAALVAVVSGYCQRLLSESLLLRLLTEAIVKGLVIEAVVRVSVIESIIGWLQLVGSSNLQVSFAEFSLFYRALLQKRPLILRSLLIEATPYQRPV